MLSSTGDIQSPRVGLGLLSSTSILSGLSFSLNLTHYHLQKPVKSFHNSLEFQWGKKKTLGILMGPQAKYLGTFIQWLHEGNANVGKRWSPQTQARGQGVEQ